MSRTFDGLWDALLPIGRTDGGYRRLAWTSADADARAWFETAARERGLELRTDRNGNLWAWWLPEGWEGPPVDAFVTGSHLDSVPDGGAYDGPLGVVSGLAAVDLLRARGWRPTRPVAVVVMVDEEGGRFGVACAGSRLLTGSLDPEHARGLTDSDGVTMAAAMTAAGHDPAGIGRDAGLLAQVGVFVELHVEQGRALVHRGAAVGVAEAIWPHGRWRMSFAGEANHAGTTRLEDRRDPMLPFATAVLAARDAAARHGAVATLGRVSVVPNATNAVPSSVRAWLDARAATEAEAAAVVSEVESAARRHCAEHGVLLEMVRESWSAGNAFDPALRDRVAGWVGDAPAIPTGAGHDAGVLAAAGVPTAMLFVRNRTGVSHAPAEWADPADCHEGVEALARVIEGWSG